MDVSRDITRRKQEQQALKESQKFVQQIVDTSPNILYIHDLTENINVYSNNQVSSILGYSPSELQAMGSEMMSQILHPEDAARMEAHYASLIDLQEGQVSEIEFRMRHSNGRWHWLSSREAVFLCNAAGKTRQVIGIAEDITERKWAQESLQHRVDVEQLITSISTKFINLPIENIEQGIYEALVSVSQFTEADCSFAYRYLPDERKLARVSSWFAQAHVDVDPNFEIPVDQIPWTAWRLGHFENINIPRVAHLPTDARYEQELLQRFNVQSCILIPLVYSNTLLGILGFATCGRTRTWIDEDIQILKTIGDIFTNAIVHQTHVSALRDSEARYRAIVDDHQTEMIFRFLPDGTLTFVNETFCKTLDRNRNDLIGSNYLDLVREEDRDYVRTVYLNLTPERPTSTFENQVLLPNGETHWQEITDRAIFDAAGNTVEIQSVGRDITERKMMEAQIRGAQTKLAQVTRLASIGELAASVAHQINNPLTTIIAEAQIMLQKLEKDHPGNESAQLIEAAGWRAQKVVQELLEFSQPSSNASENININQTIQQALTLVGAQITSDGISLDVQLDEHLPPVYGNARQLEDLWVNLLLVSRTPLDDHKPDLVRVVSIHPEGSWNLVEFHSDGRWVPAEELDTIFEPSLIPTSNQNLTGLELSICREIVRQNQGNIIVFNSEQGTVFRVSLPTEAQYGFIEHTGN